MNIQYPTRNVQCPSGNALRGDVLAEAQGRRGNGYFLTGFPLWGAYVTGLTGLHKGRATASRLAVKTTTPSIPFGACHPFINEGEVGSCRVIVTSPSLVKGWLPKADGVVFPTVRVENPKHTSVGQRPTLGDTPISKPCKGVVRERNRK